jgi:glutamate formiminotransferase / formiminotetrahydrofolate cyclodeaminase
MEQIVECVPNFSDGRNPEVYEAIADTIRQVPSVQLIDVSADADHNRSVMTFIGSPAAVVEAAFQAIALAAQRINLDEHSGEHPRLGATDVCPIVPIRNITIEECVALAQQLGERVGQELGIAVYLYGAAATRPERERLAAIRRGQYERWREEIGHDPAREPDFGPAEPRTWGATTIGVRPFLIAYNLYLNSDNVAIADKISRAVRQSSGGLPHVQAKGFLVEGQAQVSMNLTDFSKTPIARVQELVKREAARYGLTVTRAELIGLAPQKALVDAAAYYLQLDGLEDTQIVEHHVQQLQEKSLTPTAYLEATAAAKPTPGGGSAAAMAGALGAALAQMVAGLTVGRKAYAQVSDEAETILYKAAELRQSLTAAIVADMQAFDALMQAWRNKELAETERQAAIEKATFGAAEVPLHVARLARDVAKLAQTIATIGNRNAVTDATAGAILARAAVQIALLNVKINLVDLTKQENEAAAKARAYLAEADNLYAETRQIVAVVTQEMALDA